MLLMACEATGPRQQAAHVALSDALSSCSEYRQEDVFAYCIYQKAEYLETLEEVEHHCPLAKKWEESCRHTWGAKRARNPQGLSFSQLIEGCAGFSDCAFEVIDALPSKDIHVQLKRCHDYVVADNKDCVSHAMQSWLNKKPSKEAVRTFMDKEAYLSDTAILLLAQEDFCQGWNVCTEQSNNDIKCRQYQKKRRMRRDQCRKKWGNIAR